MRPLTVILVVLLIAAAVFGWYRYYQEVAITKRLNLDLAAYRRLPELTKDFTPAIFVRANGTDVTFQVPAQVTRDGQVFIDYQEQHAPMAANAEIIPPVGDSLHPMTLSDIRAGTPIRVGLDTNPTNPNDVTISVIYILQ